MQRLFKKIQLTIHPLSQKVFQGDLAGYVKLHNRKLYKKKTARRNKIKITLRKIRS